MDDDADLAARVRRGDRQAFDDLYDLYADDVFSMCLLILGDPTVARAAAGTAFALVARTRLNPLSDPARLRSWLLELARGSALAWSGSPQARSIPVPHGVPPEELLVGSVVPAPASLRVGLARTFDRAAAVAEAAAASRRVAPPAAPAAPREISLVKAPAGPPSYPRVRRRGDIDRPRHRARAAADADGRRGRSHQHRSGVRPRDPGLAQPACDGCRGGGRRRRGRSHRGDELAVVRSPPDVRERRGGGESAAVSRRGSPRHRARRPQWGHRGCPHRRPDGGRRLHQPGRGAQGSTAPPRGANRSRRAQVRAVRRAKHRPPPRNLGSALDHGAAHHSAEAPGQHRSGHDGCDLSGLWDPWDLRIDDPAEGTGATADSHRPIAGERATNQRRVAPHDAAGRKCSVRASRPVQPSTTIRPAAGGPEHRQYWRHWQYCRHWRHWRHWQYRRHQPDRCRPVRIRRAHRRPRHRTGTGLRLADARQRTV